MTEKETAKNVKISYENEILSVFLLGEIDHHSAIHVRTYIDEALFLHIPKKLIIDIGQVDFMDSSGLGLIMGRYTKTKELGTVLIVRNPSPRASKMLALSGLEKIIQIQRNHESEETKNAENTNQ